MKMSLFVSLCCSVVFYSSAGQAACVQPPSCDELGFTADVSKCEGSFLKCPWDLTKAACKENKITTPTELPILYGDGTIAKGIIDGKTPIGIVFDETNKLAMALTDIQGGTVWSNDYSDIFNLENCLDNDYRENSGLSGGDSTYIVFSVVTCSPDGKANTIAMGNLPAAKACKTYEPEGCDKDFCKQTNWFLPSMRDLQNMYNNKEKINSILDLSSSWNVRKLGRSVSHWSSNEESNMQAWAFSMSDGKKFCTQKNLNTRSIRPVIHYEEPKKEILPILYGDGTISKNIISSKTPIGIVFDERHKFAVALTNVKKDGSSGDELMSWLSYDCDIYDLKNCNYNSYSTTKDYCGGKGRENTTAILTDTSCSGGRLAAAACNKYEPANCEKDFCKKTNWFLPSFKELESINVYRNQINMTLEKLKAFDTTIIDSTYWSSSESDDRFAWPLTIGEEKTMFAPKQAECYVRPVVHYE